MTIVGWEKENALKLGSFNNIIGKPFLVVLVLGTFFVGFLLRWKKVKSVCRW